MTRARLTRAPTPPSIPSQAGIAGEAGWRAFGNGQHPSQQIGAYAGLPLNQFPALIPGVQLHGGREGNNPGWYYPSRSVVPQYQQTQQFANLPGGQRRGSTFTGPIGPITARLFRARVAAAAVPQTSLFTQPWAQQLMHRGNDE